MLPLSQLDPLLSEGRLKEAAKLLDEVPTLPRALQIVRLGLEAQIGNPKAARRKAEEWLSAHLTTLERISCLDIVGRVSVTHGDVSGGIRAFRTALELAVGYEDKVVEARQHARLTDALLHWVSIDLVLPELTTLRKRTIQAGDARASIEFHLLGAEIAMKRLQGRRAAAHFSTAEGMLARYPNLLQLARLKLLQGIDTLSSSKFTALALFEEAHQLSLRAGSITVAIPLLGNIAHTTLALARFADCRKYLDKLAPLLRRGGGAEVSTLDNEMLLALFTGESERADALAEAIAGLSSRLDDGNSYHGVWHKVIRVGWLYRRGRTAEGLVLALDAMPYAARIADDILLQRMRLATAEGFALTQRPRDAAGMLAMGVLGSPDPSLEMQAEASRVAGIVAAADDLPAAVAHFERATRIFSTIGSVTARGETIVAVGDAFAHVDGEPTGGGWQDLPELYRQARQTSVRLDTADSIVADSRRLSARVIESVGAALDLAVHPTLFGHELMQILHGANAVDVVALVERCDSQPPEVPVWIGCDAARARTLAEESLAVRIPLGTGHGRTCEIVALPPEAPAARVTLLAVERLILAALELHAARQRERERATFWPEQSTEGQFGMVFASESMLELLETARRVAATNVAVLITGETGTGKELLARAVHEASPRRERPFVPFNCTAVAREMIDAQLFGYRRGAFTGAQEAFPGVIRAATGGTLFLDEIGEVGLDVQPKLLRFLESGEVHPLSEARPTTADVRIVAATNANLDRLVSEGRFREDLFYRLDVVRLKIPPLRERREEIPLLVDHFLEKFSLESKKLGLRVAEETMEYLVLYRWPGNVRQLANEIHRMVALAEPGALLMPEHLSRDIATSRRTVATAQRERAPTELIVRLDQPLSAASEHLERAMVMHAMQRTDGRVEDAARILGLSRKGLYLKRQRFGLD